MFKKILAMTMAVACVFALAVSASAATSLPDTANMYVTAEDNPLEPVHTLGLTAYLTGSTDGTTYPTQPGTNNATITTNGDTTTVAITLTNDFARFVSLPATVEVTANGDLLSSDDVSVAITGTATNSAGIVYATEVTYTFKNDTYEAGVAYRIAGCTIYAENSLIAALNGGRNHVMAVTMMGE